MQNPEKLCSLLVLPERTKIVGSRKIWGAYGSRSSKEKNKIALGNAPTKKKEGKKGLTFAPLHTTERERERQRERERWKDKGREFVLLILFNVDC